MLRCLLILWLALLPLHGRAEGPIPLPPLTAAVTDLTGTLAASDKAALEANLQAFNEASGSQIVILIVPATAPESIEQFSIRLAESWKIGRKQLDDGVIVIPPGQPKLVPEIAPGIPTDRNDSARSDFEVPF